MDRTTFDTLYWAHQPPEVRNLHNLDHNYTYPGDSPRVTEAKRLAAKGYLIDAPIHVLDWDAFDVMSLRISYGLTVTPSINGVPIKVSLDIADYPPFDPPVQAPAQPKATDEMIGNPVFGMPNWFYVGAPDNFPDGATVETPTKGLFRKHRTPGGGFIGTSWVQFWEKMGA